jgi:hypothetical protein
MQEGVGTMSTQELQVPQTWTGTTNAKRFGAAALVVGALAVGAVVGRSTAPTAQVREAVRPATALSNLGPRSVGDLKRAQYHAAMAQAAVLSTTGELSLGDARRAEMFEAMNGLSPAASADPSDGWAGYVLEHRAMNQLLPQQAG